MENPQMSDSMVIVIQPRTDDIKNELHVEEYTAQTSSRPPSDSNVVLQSDTMLEDQDEQDLLIPMGANAELAVSDVKPELQCNIKHENTSDITEPMDVKSAVQRDLVPKCQLNDSPGYSEQQCSEDITVKSAELEVSWHESMVNQSIGKCEQIQTVYTHRPTLMDNKDMSDAMVIAIKPDDIKDELHLEEYTAQTSSGPPRDSIVTLQYDTMLENTDKDKQGLLIPLGINTEVALPDVKPELQCNIKQENTSDITESMDVKSAVQRDLVPKCQLNDDNPGYSKQQCTEDITLKSAEVLEVSWHESKVNQSIGKCEQIETVYKNSDQLVDKSGSDHKDHNINEELSKKNEQFTDSNRLKKHIRTHPGEKIFFCPHCDKRFNQKFNLFTHIRTHTGEKPFSCAHCDKRFSRKSDLSTHIRTHTGEKPFSCLHCDKRFSRSSALAYHIRTHTGEKPFACPHCDKRFIQKFRLSTHVRTHTGEKPFSCAHCDKRFSCKSDLSTHIRTHTGEKPYSCSHCDKRFSRRSYLSEHMRTHTGEKPFSCPHCDRRFNQKANLSTHVRIHTDEKLYSCSYCRKGFNSSSSLSYHIRTNHGEKPFACPLCDKRFIQKFSLSTHVRTHTGAKPFSCSAYDR